MFCPLWGASGLSTFPLLFQQYIDKALSCSFFKVQDFLLQQLHQIELRSEPDFMNNKWTSVSFFTGHFSNLCSLQITTAIFEKFFYFQHVHKMKQKNNPVLFFPPQEFKGENVFFSLKYCFFQNIVKYIRTLLENNGNLLTVSIHIIILK